MRSYEFTTADLGVRLAVAVLLIIGIPYLVVIPLTILGSARLGLSVGAAFLVWFACAYVSWFTVSLPENCGVVVRNSLHGMLLGLFGQDVTRAQHSAIGSTHIVLYPWEAAVAFYNMGPVSLPFSVSPSSAKLVRQSDGTEIIRMGEGARHFIDGSVQLQPSLRYLPRFHAIVQASTSALSEGYHNEVTSFLGYIVHTRLPWEVQSGIRSISHVITNGLVQAKTDRGLPFEWVYAVQVLDTALRDADVSDVVQDGWDREAVGRSVADSAGRFQARGVNAKDAMDMAGAVHGVAPLTRTETTHRFPDAEQIVKLIGPALERLMQRGQPN